jgi:DNA-binding XRE family transcriptional regulator
LIFYSDEKGDDAMIPINFARPIRHQLGLTLDDLASIAKVSKSTLGRIERMEVDPKLSDAIKISHGLGFKLEHVFDIDYETLTYMEK